MTDGEGKKELQFREDRHPEDEALRARTEAYRDHEKRRQRPYHRDGDAVEVPHA